MKLDRLRAHAQALPGATVQVQWGDDLVFKVGGKLFLVVSRDADLPEALSFKVTAEDFARLPEESDAYRPAPYLARARWLQLTDPDAVAEARLRAHVEGSYQLVRASLPRKTQAQLATGSARPRRR